MNLADTLRTTLGVQPTSPTILCIPHGNKHYQYRYSPATGLHFLNTRTGVWLTSSYNRAIRHYVESGTIDVLNGLYFSLILARLQEEGLIT